MESRERETDEGEDRESLLARSSTTVKEKEEGEEGSTLPDLFFFFAVVVVKTHFISSTCSWNGTSFSFPA